MYDIGTVPDGWFVLWCEVCLLSVSFTEADVDSYGVEWPEVLSDAAIHDEHPDGTRAP